MKLPGRGEFWVHYKGGCYIVLSLAHEEATGDVVVVYRQANPPPSTVYHAQEKVPPVSGDPKVFTRPLGSFLGQAPTKEPRFRLLEVTDRAVDSG